ncbi:MAG: translation initiation factor [Vulcanimicrobiota bacterium]
MELAYSSDPDWCSQCKHLPCQCQKKLSRTTGTGKVKMRRERRRGKDTIVIFETRMAKPALQELLKLIQKSCGAGGTVKGDTIEIQGDHRDKIQTLLEEQGLKVTRAGG